MTYIVLGIDAVTENAGRFGWTLDHGERTHKYPMQFGKPYADWNAWRGDFWRLPWSNGVSESAAVIDESVTIEFLEDGE